MQPVQPGAPPTLKQMMSQSPAFKCLFATSIVLVLTVIVLGIVAPNVSCRDDYSCYWWYGSSYSIECSYYDQPYCCKSGYYSRCGDSYCVYKPSSYGSGCSGVFIAMWVCTALAIFLAVVVLIMFCQFRKRARNPVLNPGANYVQVNDQNYLYNPNYQQQPHYHAQPNNYQQPNYAQAQANNYQQPNSYQQPVYHPQPAYKEDV
jgi:hypothetical protein